MTKLLILVSACFALAMGFASRAAAHDASGDGQADRLTVVRSDASY